MSGSDVKKRAERRKGQRCQVKTGRRMSYITVYSSKSEEWGTNERAMNHAGEDNMAH